MLLNGLYVIVLLVLSPWLVWRRIVTGRYRQGMSAKLFGRITFKNPDHRPVAWFHGVSVGEIHLLSTVVSAFRKRHPDWLVVVSSTTETGLSEARNRFSDLTVIPFPFDFTWAVRRVIATLQPRLLVLAEGELWPNLLRLAKSNGCRTVAINARLSPRSFRRYRRIAWLARRLVFRHLDRIAVQSEEYAERFRQLNIEPAKLTVTGSIKYDGAIGRTITHPLADAVITWKAQGMIWVAGSTHAPEEEIVLSAYKRLKESFPGLRLLLVPRHPDRFDEVAGLIERTGISFLRRSAITDAPVNLPPILLLDTVGELGFAWSIADVGYVGGTLDGRRGGQSMIEPAGFGVPTIFGPHDWNFRDAAARLVEAGGAIRIPNRDQLIPTMTRLLEDAELRTRMGRLALDLVRNQQGATARTLNVLDGLMPPAFAAAA